MDWTTIIVSCVGGAVSLGTIALPIMLNRTNRKTRALNAEGTELLGKRIDAVEASVTTLCAQVNESHKITQGLHLLDVIEHRPHCWETIRQMFAEYQRVGGNGHVGRVYQQWEADYGRYYDAGEVPPNLLKNTEK